jgi:hypothetical protein
MRRLGKLRVSGEAFGPGDSAAILDEKVLALHEGVRAWELPTLA